jgi:hypothetical protein
MPVIIEKEDWVFWLGEDLSNFIYKRLGFSVPDAPAPMVLPKASQPPPA